MSIVLIGNELIDIRIQHDDNFKYSIFQDTEQVRA